jgi:hypothetical protein
MIPWIESHRFDPRARPLADRHYNRRKPGTPQFAPPGRCLVLLAPAADALWISSWPRAEYAWHAWAGAWVCTCFRREGGPQASELIRAALAATRHKWGTPPPLGLVTFVNPKKTRRKRDPGRCFLRAGFRVAGETAGGLVVLQVLPRDMPEPAPAGGMQVAGLFDRQEATA